VAVQPGGYRDTEVPPWIPIGVTGRVVRRAERNSTVVAAALGDALMIPKELVREWFRPYEQGELADVLAEMGNRSPTSTSSETGRGLGRG
jgi:hypothetical protein